MAKNEIWTKDFILITLVNFMTATNFYLLLVVISDYAMNVCYASPSVAGFTGGIFIIGSCIARILIGKEMNRFGYRRSLCMGIILSVVMSLSYFVATNIPVLLIIRFLHGMAFGISTTVSSTIVADMLPGDRIGEGIGYYCLSQTFATAIGPFLALFLTKSGNFNMIFAVSALAAVISLVLIPIIHIPAQEVLEKATGIHTKFNLNNLLEVNVIPLSLVALLIFLCYSSVTSFLSPYVQEIKLVEASSFFFLVYALLTFVSRLYSGKMMDKRGENIVMNSVIVCTIIGLVLLASAQSGIILLLAAAFLGIGVSNVQATSQAVCAKITPKHRLGMANSTFFVIGDIGMGFGPFLAGLMIHNFGYSQMYYIMSGIAFICIPLYFLVHGKNAKAKKIVYVNN